MADTEQGSRLDEVARETRREIGGLHEETRRTAGGMHEETRTLIRQESAATREWAEGEFRPLLAMELADAVTARIERVFGSCIDARYLVEIGIARLDLAELDGRCRRGEPVDARGAFAKLDDLLRRMENAIIHGAREEATFPAE